MPGRGLEAAGKALSLLEEFQVVRLEESRDGRLKGEN